MNKAVLISIRQEWCQKIIAGQKTIARTAVRGWTGRERRMMNLKEIFKHYADDLGEGADIRIGGRHDRQTFEVPNR